MTLKIRKKGGNYYPIKIGSSILISYIDICKVLNKKLQKDNEIDEKDLKPLKIHLKHPEKKEITIYNKEEWNILYNYNIINECVNNNTLKIDYEENKNINNLKENKIKLIKNHIMEKLPDKFYLHILYKFFSKNKCIEELFKQFFLKQIIESNINEIKDLKLENENLKQSIKSLFNTNEIFFKEENKIQNATNIKNLITLKNIRDIIENGIEKEEELLNNNLNIYYNEISDENIEKNKSIKNIEKNKNILLNFNNSDFVRKKLLDENNYFKIINEKDYYLGIEKFKDLLYRENIFI